MTAYWATRDWPHAQPFQWYRDIVKAGPVGADMVSDADDYDAWIAAINTLRSAVGMTTVGHGQTYDFFVAMRSIKRLEGFHKPSKRSAK